MSPTQNLAPNPPTPLLPPTPSDPPLPVAAAHRVAATSACRRGPCPASCSSWPSSRSSCWVLLWPLPTLFRRRPLTTLLVRDTAWFARHWWGKVLVVVVLVALPAAMVVTSLAGSRYGRYADDSWKALLLLVVLVVAYLASRRLVVTVLIGAVTVALVSWALSPNLADARNGDATVLAGIDVQAHRGTLAGHHDIAVAQVDLDAAQPVRLAGSVPTTRRRWRSVR